jgi:hypothetical protein
MLTAASGRNASVVAVRVQRLSLEEIALTLVLDRKRDEHRLFVSHQVIQDLLSIHRKLNQSIAME